MLQPVYLTKALLPMLLKRKQKSAIVLTSSVVSWVATPGISIYSNTKAAVATFMEALHYETKAKIDIYSWDCGSVNTKLNTFPLGWRTSTETAVLGCFKDIGRERRSFGCWKSELEGLTTPALPIFVQKLILLREAK